MRRLSLAFALFFLTAATAQAAPLPELKGTITAQAPIGKATYKLLFLTIYDATLWSDSKDFDWNKPFALSLRWDVDSSAQKIIDRSIDEMNGNSRTGPLDAATQARYRAIMATLLTDVADGERTTALYVPDQGVRFYHNGSFTAASKDTGFARAFLGIWLDEGTTEPAFRKKLLAPAR